MVYTSDLQQLMAMWQIRAGNSAQPNSYRDAINECVYDLGLMIRRSDEEEALHQEAFEEMYADDFLSSMEAHEAV